MAKHLISPELYEDLTEKLDLAMDARDDVAEKKKRVTSALGGEIKVLDNTIKKLRRQRKGLESPQEEIPGTEAGERRRDPAIEALLRVADGLPARASKGAKPPEPEKLNFLTEKPGVDLARVEGGIYSVRSSVQGYSATWDPDKGRIKTLVTKVPAEEAYTTCERHHLERLATEQIRNAGDAP